MLTFFHGWRRKMGVATLLVACVLAIGWLRSIKEFDGIYAGAGDFVFVASMHQSICVGRCYWDGEYWRMPVVV